MCGARERDERRRWGREEGTLRSRSGGDGGAFGHGLDKGAGVGGRWPGFGGGVAARLVMWMAAMEATLLVLWVHDDFGVHVPRLEMCNSEWFTIASPALHLVLILHRNTSRVIAHGNH